MRLLVQIIRLSIQPIDFSAMISCTAAAGLHPGIKLRVPMYAYTPTPDPEDPKGSSPGGGTQGSDPDSNPSGPDPPEDPKSNPTSTKKTSAANFHYFDDCRPPATVL